MSIARKLTAAQIRQLPDPVQSRVQGLMKQYHTRNVRLRVEAPGSKLYLAEGCKYSFFYGDNEAAVRMQASHSPHAGGHPTSYRVGQRVDLPQGTWVIETELFCGRPFITAINIGVTALAAPTN